MILDYEKNGNYHNKLSWKKKFNDLFDIASGLNFIHKNELIRDLQIGNILMSSRFFT